MVVVIGATDQSRRSSTLHRQKGRKRERIATVSAMIDELSQAVTAAAVDAAVDDAEADDDARKGKNCSVVVVAQSSSPARSSTSVCVVSSASSASAHQFSSVELCVKWPASAALSE